MDQVLINLILSGAGILGINYIFTLAAGNYFSNGVFLVPVWAALYYLVDNTIKRIRSVADGHLLKRRVAYSAVLSILFAISMVIGWQIKVNGMTESGFTGKGKILFMAILLGMAVFPFAYAFFEFLDKVRINGMTYNGTEKDGRHINSRKLFLILWGIIFICWIPVFLAYYPAVMAYDFNVQSLQAAWGPPYFSAHHPIIHTLLIWIAFEIGEALGSLQLGMAIYSIFQMLVVSAALAYAATFIYRLIYKRLPVFITTAFFALFPYNSILAVSVTKDVLFSAFFLIFILLLMERIFFEGGRNKILLTTLTFLDGVVMLTFRNNAIYALMAFTVFSALLMKGRERIRIFILCVLVILGGKLGLEGLLKVTGYFGNGSAAEMYSVPMQQFARVGYYHGILNGNKLTDDIYDTIDHYVSHEVWPDYNPPLADTVKFYVSANQFKDYWQDDISGMWKAWIKVGMHYPNEYIDAFLCLTNGYWFIDDVTWAENIGYGLEERKGALFTFNASESDMIPEGILNESKIPFLEKILEEVVSNNCFYDWPIVSILFKPAFYCWILFICALGYLYQRKKSAFILTILPFMYLGTLALGPVVIVRYIMPFILLAPVLITLLFYEKNKN